MAELCMPALGSDMEAGTLVAWRRKPGDRLVRGDIIAEVETDKGVIEIEVFAPAVLERLLVEPGQKVPVGTPLALLSDPATEPASTPPTQEPLPPARALTPRAEPASAPALATASGEQNRDAPRASPSARQRARELGIDLNALAGTGVATREDVERAAANVATRWTSAPRPITSEEAKKPARIRASPAARRRAQVLGLELTGLIGTGPEGAITLRDVERAAAEKRTAPLSAPASEPRAPTSITASDRQHGLRRAIAAAMARSKREIPHYYLSTTVDLGAATAWLSARNTERSVRERLLLGVLLLKAVALAAKRMPELNARFSGDDAPPLKDVHLGVAIALRGGGLVAPAIHHADGMPIDALMAALQDLVARARAGTLRSSELSDGTITVTNLGERGVETVFPIIYSPQTAIVGFGRIVERPWVVQGALAVRPVVTATLAADHRVTDGHFGARFLTLIDTLLQEPDKL